MGQVQEMNLMDSLVMQRASGAFSNWLFKDSGDWRTLGLATFCYFAYIALLFGGHTLPVWGTVLILVPVLTLHSSLQHEIIHGHPFHNQLMNDLLVILPFGLLVPYYRFKDTHLEHHFDANLCDPYEDPESWYQAREDWIRRGRISQSIFNINNTLVGRMALGPFIGMTGFVRSDLRQIISGDFGIAAKWMLHLALATLLVIVVARYGNIPVVGYFFAAYGGMSLLMVRTFLEHQAQEKVRGRSVIIEKGGVFGFLFLNNSFHAVHHACPNHAWYRLPELFMDNRERFLKMNNGYSYLSYGAVFRQFSFKRKEPVPYPDELKRQNSR